MANKDDYLTTYREFFENFAQTVNPDDQLPVNLGSYRLLNLEVIGGIIDWTTQYLTQAKCPQSLIAPLIHIIIDETRKTCKKKPTACGFNSSDNVYEPLKLMQTVMAKTNDICLRYLDNSMLCSLPPPGPAQYVVCVSASKNKRKTMEDRHVVIHDLNTIFNIQECSPSSYYAVFDGHAGHLAAVYSAAHLHQYLAESEYFVNNPEQALLDAFCKTDKLFIEKSNAEGFTSGTTAVVALVRPKLKLLYIAWVGDSQALLVNQGRVLQCVRPHKPCREDEKSRIEKDGGYVCFWGAWRVNGQLAVSRAIGDAEYKPYVIAVPEIREIALDGGEDFLIIACDGLWDYLSEDDAAQTVYNMVCQCPDKTDLIGDRLVLLSKERGSTDNISVIVVFLREPSKISAEAHWANRNGSPITMDTSLDNANNPFANSNGDNNIIQQKPSDGLLLNLSDNFKTNGSSDTDLSPANADEYYLLHGKEKSNGKSSTSDFDDDEDDLGPETDVDALDDILSPSIIAAKALAEGIVNNNPDGSFNPFVEKAALEIDFDLQKQQSSEFDGERSPREETPTPPADVVHDGGIEENVADSGEESEDEWNYIKGEEANKESVHSSQPDLEVADILEAHEDDDSMSQLNPNAAEFVPVSPTRSIPSPASRLINDQIIAQSPKRPSEVDINVPSPQDFESEVKSRPSDFDSCSNGHELEGDRKTPDLMENLLNGKNIDEIPEFQPGNTPTKVPSTSDEFHFGPNATPFTPGKFLDQSQASNMAVYGDDSTLDASAISFKKEEDPMSMSFYQADKTEQDSSVLDMNKVHLLPDIEDSSSDEVIQTTDLDREENKENASPVPQQVDLIAGFCQLPKSPNPPSEDKIDFINVTEALVCDLPREIVEQSLGQISKSPEPQIHEIEDSFCQDSKPSEDLLSPSPLEQQQQEELCLLPKSPEPIIEDTLQPKSPVPTSEDLCQISSESPAPSEDFCRLSRSPEVLTPEPAALDDFCSFQPKSPVSGEEPKLETPLIASPVDDITSSVKDVSSPIQSPLPDEHVHFAHEIKNPVQDSIDIEASSPIRNVEDIVIPETPETVGDTESVATADVNSFLNRTDLTDVTSPIMSPEVDFDGSLNLDIPLRVCVYPLPTEFKTDNIVPEFAEPAVITPTTETPSAPLAEPVVEAEKVAVAAATAAAAGVVVAAAATAVNKKTPKPKTPTSTKKPSSTTKTTTSPIKKTTTTPSTAAARTSAAPRLALPKTSTAKPSAASAKPAPKPRTTTSTTTTAAAAKKPLTNGVAAKSAVKKTLDTSKSATARPSSTSTTTRLTTTKPAASRPTTAPAKTWTTTSATTAARTAPKPRPTTLASKTTSAGGTLTSKSTTTTVSTARTVAAKSATSPKTTSPPKPRTTTVPAKPRVPLSSRTTTSKTADAEKQSKDSANKLTAARTTTTRTTTGATSGRTLSTTVRKTETKTSGATRTTLTKMTTTAKASAGKKPQELIRNVSKTKTTTTKIEKPVENGVATVVTEEITVVNNTVNNDSEALVKDNSPTFIDNKLILDATNTAD